MPTPPTRLDVLEYIIPRATNRSPPAQRTTYCMVPLVLFLNISVVDTVAIAMELIGTRTYIPFNVYVKCTKCHRISILDVLISFVPTLGLDKPTILWYNHRMSELNGHGGKREGAGRKTKINSVRSIQADKVVGKKMKLLAEQGWEVLADSYPDLMRRAVEIAIGNEDKAPNITMLRTLLELMVKVTGTETEVEDTQLSKMVGRFLDRVQETRTPNGRTVDVGSRGPLPSADSEHAIRTRANPPISGMGSGVAFEQPE